MAHNSGEGGRTPQLGFNEAKEPLPPQYSSRLGDDLPGAAAAAAAGMADMSLDGGDKREQLFRDMIITYEIGQDFAQKLQKLNGFKIVFVFDDSSSMNSLLDDSPLLKKQPQVTRWNELEYFASVAVEIANFFDPNGCDIYFLNKQPPIKNVRHMAELSPVFRDYKPRGYTPLTRALNHVLSDNQNLVNFERKILILIVTDGEPTDEKGNSDINGFKKCLQNRQPIERIFTNIIACTDQDDSIEYLNRMDRSIKHLDVIDDYRNEKREVIKKRGTTYPFSYGDYVCKAMIGAVDKSLDIMDEKRDRRDTRGEKRKSIMKRIFKSFDKG